MNFKAKFKRLFIRWIITVLDSGVARDSEKCRPDMYQAIQWERTAWDEVTADTIKNCWNKVKIMPISVVVAGGGTRDAVFDELHDLLVSMGKECDVMAFVVQPDERWTVCVYNHYYINCASQQTSFIADERRPTRT
jgi:hypothetical protein